MDLWQDWGVCPFSQFNCRRKRRTKSNFNIQKPLLSWNDGLAILPSILSWHRSAEKRHRRAETRDVNKHGSANGRLLIFKSRLWSLEFLTPRLSSRNEITAKYIKATPSSAPIISELLALKEIYPFTSPLWTEITYRLRLHPPLWTEITYRQGSLPEIFWLSQLWLSPKFSLRKMNFHWAKNIK
jgi:hypothetical protein